MGVVEKRGEGIEKLGETEGARRATGVFPSAAPGAGSGAGPEAVEAEVVAKAQRRRFTVEYKRRILREADRCTHPGEIGALLRREGLYSSHLTTWRAARDRGELAGVAPQKRGPTPRIRPPCSWMNFRERASPSPVPSTFLSAVPTSRNSSKTAS